MRLVGIVLWALGLILFAYAAFIFDPSVESRVAARLQYDVRDSIYLPERVINADRQQRQLLLAMAGLKFFLAGVIIHGLGHLLPEDKASKTPVRPTRAYRNKSADTPANAELLAQHGIRPGNDGAQI